MTTTPWSDGRWASRAVAYLINMGGRCIYCNVPISIEEANLSYVSRLDRLRIRSPFCITYISLPGPFVHLSMTHLGLSHFKCLNIETQRCKKEMICRICKKPTGARRYGGSMCFDCNDNLSNVTNRIPIELPLLRKGRPRKG